MTVRDPVCGMMLAREQAAARMEYNPALAEASVLYEPRVVDFKGLQRAIEASGYRAAEAPAATETGVDKQEQERQQEYRALMRKFRFAAVISLPVMHFSYPAGRARSRCPARCTTCPARLWKCPAACPRVTWAQPTTNRCLSACARWQA